MTTNAWLDGHQFDLQDLAELLSLGDVRVVREDDSYYLTSPEIDHPPQGATFYEVAASLLAHVNGLGRVKNPSFRPVELNGKYTEGESQHGESQHYVVSPAPAEIRVRTWAAGVVTKSDGTIVPDPPSPWPDRFALAETNPDVAKVLQIMSSGEKLDWVALYKVYEKVERDIKRATIVKLGWATDDEISAFTGSANNYKVSGDAARHAVDKGSGYPKHTMTIDEGRAFISDLVTKWLGSLAGD